MCSLLACWFSIQGNSENDAQRAGMIDPSLKRPQRRRVQSGSQPSGLPVCRSTHRRLPHGGQPSGPAGPASLHTRAGQVRLCSPVARPAETSPPAWFSCFRAPSAVTALCQGRQCLPPGDADCRSPTCTHMLLKLHVEAELGFCRPPSVPLLGKACPLSRDHLVSAGEHGLPGDALAIGQSTPRMPKDVFEMVARFTKQSQVPLL